MDRIREAPLLTKLSFIPMFAGFVFDVIGFASPYWIRQDIAWTSTHFHFGLWQACGTMQQYFSFTVCQPFPSSIVTSSFTAARVFAVLGLIGTLTTPLLTLLCLVLAIGTVKSVLSLLSACSSVTTVLCLLISVVVFAAENGTGLSWAFILCVIAAIFYVVVTVMIVAGFVQYRKVISRY